MLVNWGSISPLLSIHLSVYSLSLVAAHDGRLGDFNHHYAHHLKGKRISIDIWKWEEIEFAFCLSKGRDVYIISITGSIGLFGIGFAAHVIVRWSKRRNPPELSRHLSDNEKRWSTSMCDVVIPLSVNRNSIKRAHFSYAVSSFVGSFFCTGEEKKQKREIENTRHVQRATDCTRTPRAREKVLKRRVEEETKTS